MPIYVNAYISLCRIFCLSQETHIIHKFDEDFYDAILSVIMLGYIREEQNFSSLGK